MASKLILDRSDPGVDELVSQWKDGGKYVCEIEITQTQSGPNVANFDVTGISDAGMMEEEAEEAPAKKKNPSEKPMKVEY